MASMLSLEKSITSMRKLVDGGEIMEKAKPSLDIQTIYEECCPKCKRIIEREVGKMALTKA